MSKEVYNFQAGMAAGSICETLNLAVNDHKLFSGREIVKVLRDAAATHDNAFCTESHPEIHRAVAGSINQITPRNSVFA